jgi:ATP-dependent Clp protease ATP-binding subunit ClpA
MFERFDEDARQVVVLAQEEARILRHNHIGSEHLLLGLLREGDGVAATVLERLCLRVETTRAAVLRRVPAGNEAASGQLPFTPRAKNALELALREMLFLGHAEITTGHLLLGLLDVSDSVASDVLDEAEIQPQAIRTAVFQVLAVQASSGEALARQGSHARARLVVVEAWIAACELRGEVLEAIATAANMQEATRRVADLLDVSVELARQVMQLRLERLLNEGDAFRQERDVLVGLLKRLEEQEWYRYTSRCRAARVASVLDEQPKRRRPNPVAHRWLAPRAG